MPRNKAYFSNAISLHIAHNAANVVAQQAVANICSFVLCVRFDISFLYSDENSILEYHLLFIKLHKYIKTGRYNQCVSLSKDTYHSNMFTSLKLNTI